MRHLSSLILILSTSTTAAFAGSRRSSLFRFRVPRLAASTADVDVDVAAGSGGGPSTSPLNTSAAWEDLQNEISPRSDVANDNEIPTPLLTFYRDTNGWCPFCERVWVCMRVKNLPYQERLISLSNKPDWYKEMVPTTQVPAVLFHTDIDSNGPAPIDMDTDTDTNTNREPNSRKLVWESLDIMMALDEMFPDTPQLVLDTDEYKKASEMNTSLNTAGFKFVYASSGGSESESESESSEKLILQELEEKKQAFLDALDELDRAIAESGGPFRLGTDFTGVDAEIIPSLERWRYQLPLSKGIDILDSRPALVKWFQAMDSYAPYSERVAGDEYSWVATSAMFARYFGKEGDPETRATIERSEGAAVALVKAFKDAVKEDECEGRFALEAAAKVISNRDAIAKDCTNPDPKSQQHISRASASGDTADKMLFVVVKILLNKDEAIQEANKVVLEDMGIGDDEKLDAAEAAKTVASRLCAPRDMSAPAAKILRAVLMTIAERLEE